jgi:hypothetical protein
MPEDYKPVPVDAARRIANLYEKDLALIVTWDRTHNLTHVTTYGRTVELKEVAASAGERIAKMLGLDPGKLPPHEDFRFKDQALAAQELDRLTFLLERALQTMSDERLTPKHRNDAARVLAEKAGIVLEPGEGS